MKKIKLSLIWKIIIACLLGIALGKMLLAITMVAAPRVPGGAVMAALGILATSLGFNQEDQALMIALFIVMDNFGTACNVTGDGAISIIVNRFAKKDESPVLQNKLNHLCVPLQLRNINYKLKHYG